MTIYLNDIFRITDPSKYKLHLASWNGESHPLDEFVADPNAWKGWNEWRGSKNDWTRPRVMSFMDFYPKSNAWLFGGIFDVDERLRDGYKLRLSTDFEQYIGRLTVNFHRYRGMRGRAFLLESYIDSFTVNEISPQRFTGEAFPGFENISHNFGTLEAIFRSNRTDWKSALENVKGIYSITDSSNGKIYIGSAYGDAGIWSRWSCYLGTGHGWNDALVNLLNEKGLQHARAHFHFSILEVADKLTPDKTIIERESHWKKALLTRTHGYNKN